MCEAAEDDRLEAGVDVLGDGLEAVVITMGSGHEPRKIPAERVQKPTETDQEWCEPPHPHLTCVKATDGGYWIKVPPTNQTNQPANASASGGSGRARQQDIVSLYVSDSMGFAQSPTCAVPPHWQAVESG